MHEAQELIRSSRLSLPVSKKLLTEALQPRVGLSSYPWMPQGLALGASRFGGPADLPVGVEWPTNEGRRLLLLAQLNFADLQIKRDHPMLALLPAGWFCLFLDVYQPAIGIAGQEPGVVALQFDSPSHLVRHDPDPSPDLEVWTHCHAVTVHPADHNVCLPCEGAVDSPLPQAASEVDRNAYRELVSKIDHLSRTHHEATLLGSPVLFNPDLRLELPKPSEWMLLLQFDARCSWLAGAQPPAGRHFRAPSIGDADYVQYFVRRQDYAAGRLDLGYLDYMMT
jgi:hypothetical protein